MKDNRLPGQRSIDDLPSRSREDAIQDFQNEVDRFKDNLDQLMNHIHNSNFTVERIDRNLQTLRDTNKLLDSIIRVGFGIHRNEQ